MAIFTNLSNYYRISGASSKVVARVKGTVGQVHTVQKLFFPSFPVFCPATPPSLYPFNKHLLSTYCARQVWGSECTVVNRAGSVPALMGSPSRLKCGFL